MKRALPLLLLAGCNQSNVQRTDHSVGIWTDPLTGCQYLNLYGHGITPRLDRKGHIICGPALKETI